MPANPRFVLDTNVIVSALLSRNSVARQAFDRASSLGRLLVSSASAAELNAVLRRASFDRYVPEALRLEFLTAFIREAVLIDVTEAIQACRDPKDDKFLELAVNASAACIVSGDQDLLVLNPFRSIPILTPRQFLDHPFE